MDASDCKHTRLVLLKEKHNRLRCRHCHLTIAADELGSGYCPECFESTGQRRYDFDPVETPDSGAARYRCEDCGLIIPYAE